MLERAPIALKAAQTLGKLGVVSSEKVTKCTLILGWAELRDDGQIALTNRGSCVRTMPRTEAKLREALLDLVEATDPPWVQGARYGRRHVLQYSPPEIAQICRESGLANESTPEVVAFWDVLAARARGLHDVRLNETGRRGERLTLLVEERRTKCRPKWIALESNADGYDVLSQVSESDTGKLCIEVKASTQGLAGQLHLTRHEWETAQSLLRFSIHLWDLSKAAPKLATVGISEISEHVPDNRGDGSWESVCIPFSSFAYSFAPVQVQ